LQVFPNKTGNFVYPTIQPGSLTAQDLHTLTSIPANIIFERHPGPAENLERRPPLSECL